VGKWPGNVIVQHTPDCKKVGEIEVRNVINRWSDGAKPFGGGAGHPYEAVGTVEFIEQWECSQDCINRKLGKGSDGHDLGHYFKNVASESELWKFLLDLITPPGECEPVVLAEPAAFQDREWSHLPSSSIHGIVLEGDFSECVDELFRILRPGAHCVVIPAQDSPIGWRTACSLEDRGFEIRDTICVLDRLEDRAHYVPKANGTERNDGLPGGLENKHETVKPIAIMEALLEDLPVGALVADPFMGTGTTGIACVRRQCNFIGIEKEEHSFEIAHHRVRHWDAAHASWNASKIESDLETEVENNSMSLGELFGND
jgi:hypothetical protein